MGKEFDKLDSLLDKLKKTADLLKAEGDSLYHIHQDGQRITSKPKTLKDIHETHGGVRSLESQGFLVKPHTPTKPAASPKLLKFNEHGQWELTKGCDEMRAKIGEEAIAEEKKKAEAEAKKGEGINGPGTGAGSSL